MNEREMIERYRGGERDLPGSTSVSITVALSVKDYELLPDWWSDPLAAYIERLDTRQQKIVAEHRGWKNSWAVPGCSKD